MLKTAVGRVALLVLAMLGLGCATQPADFSSRTPKPPADEFFASVESLCGQAFAGRIVADVPTPTGVDPFAGKALVMHVRECNGTELRIPFHVGDNRSRTWVLTRMASGLRLKHDHRHEDGSPDAVTQYGGETATDHGTSARQEFPVDEDSKALFLREGLAASVTNTWALETDPARTFVYELSRPGGRLFRVEFDLTQPVAAPPLPWGAAR